MPCPDGLSPGFGLNGGESAAICLIKSYFGSGPDGLGRYRTGTGLLFDSGGQLRHVVTAAHNLYNHEVGRMAQWASLWFRRSGDASLATRAAGAMFVPAAFSGADEPPFDSDYGVIRVSPLGTDRFASVALAVSSATGPTAKLLVGYPNEGSCAGSSLPYHATFGVTPSGPDNYAYAGQTTYEGMSGGPLLTRDAQGGALRSYGVHIRGGDIEPHRAIRFSQGVHDAIMAWT